MFVIWNSDVFNKKRNIIIKVRDVSSKTIRHDKSLIFKKNKDYKTFKTTIVISSLGSVLPLKTSKFCIDKFKISFALK